MSERKRTILSHRDLEVFQLAFELAMRVFEHSRAFPREERYALTDQVRRSSRSVCANLAEGWRKRRYAAAFVNKLNDAEAEAAETQVWLDFAVTCGYLEAEPVRTLSEQYESVIKMLVTMINRPEDWTITQNR